MRRHWRVLLLLAGPTQALGCGNEPSTPDDPSLGSSRAATGGVAAGGSTGGGVSTGAAPPAGGYAPVGLGGTGGNAPVGPGTGGYATGGAAVGLGGSATGGVSLPAGGTATGGAATGGFGTGGMATGGASSGGGAFTGGAATGGVSAGGAATGGASTGGSTEPGTPSDGCSATNVTTGAAIDGTLSVGGTSRTYRLSVPTDYAAGEPLPVVFALHGVGGDGKGTQSSFRLETNHRGIFVYPDATYKDSSGANDWDYASNGRDVAFFDALITELTGKYCIDMDRIFAVGVSAGGIMSNKLGCFRGDVLRAIAPSSAETWQEGCTGDVAVMVICGETDQFNPCDTDGAQEIQIWSAENGCNTQTAQSPVSSICVEYQGCTAADPVLLCKHSGGHMWPTEASDFAWTFFMGLPPN